MYKAVIFDLDGTLADTMPDLMNAMNAMLAMYGYPQRSREELLSFINKGARKFVWRSLPDGEFTDENSIGVTEALNVYSKFYSRFYADETHEFCGMTDELLKLKAAGIKLGVLSNKQDKFVKKIVYKLFPEIFDSVHGQLNLPEKPCPDAAFAVAKELGADPSECAFVGDSDVDMKTGANAGMTRIGVTWGYRDEECLRRAGSDVIISDVKDLSDVILKL